MFSTTLTFDGHWRRFAVQALSASGWEVRVEHDSTIVRRAHYTDWHRLERAVEAIRREMRELQARGWRVMQEQGA
jgi:hypothetical protein